MPVRLAPVIHLWWCQKDCFASKVWNRTGEGSWRPSASCWCWKLVASSFNQKLIPSSCAKGRQYPMMPSESWWWNLKDRPQSLTVTSPLTYWEMSSLMSLSMIHWTWLAWTCQWYLFSRTGCLSLESLTHSIDFPDFSKSCSCIADGVHQKLCPAIPNLKKRKHREFRSESVSVTARHLRWTGIQNLLSWTYRWISWSTANAETAASCAAATKCAVPSMASRPKPSPCRSILGPAAWIHLCVSR